MNDITKTRDCFSHTLFMSEPINLKQQVLVRQEKHKEIVTNG